MAIRYSLATRLLLLHYQFFLNSTSMNTVLTITREEVFRSVARRMEWEGTRSPLEKDAYGRVSVSEADYSLLHSVFDEVAMQTIDVCRPFLQSVVNSDKALILNISISDSVGSEIEDSLQGAVFNMMSMSMLAQWMEIVCPDRALRVQSRCEDCKSKVLAILYHHPVPVRRKA